MPSNVESIYPLSPMQEGMLFHTLYAPESGVYFVQTVYPMRQRLNIAAFERAWQHVIDRHPALRTSFVWNDLKKPVQVVEKQLKVSLSQYDWREMSRPEQEERLREHLGADRREGFNLSAPPLMRLALIRVGEESYRFIWSWHHLLMDGWSSSLVVKEAIRFYEALCKGEALRLEQSRPYQDYIAWLQRQNPAEAERYWRRVLKGFTSPTNVGATVAVAENPDESGGRYGEESIQLSVETTAALQAMARRERLTLNTVAQGAWAMLLSRHGGGEEDVLFGAVVSGRPAELAGVETMVGLFINTLPVRVQIDGHAEVLQWLRSLQAAQAEARRYEHTSLVQIQGWSEVHRSLPLFESLFVFENYSAVKPQAGREQRSEGLQTERVRSYEQVNYPLAVVVVPGERLSVEISFDCVQMNGARVRQLLTHYGQLLEALSSAREGQRLYEIEMLSGAARLQILSQWNDTATEYSLKCTHELFEAQAESRGEAPAVVCGQESLSYAELNRRANQLANYLRRLGVKRGALVGICVERGMEMVIGVLGILKAGAAYVPLDPTYPQSRLSFMLEDARVPVLLTQRKLLKDLPSHEARTICLDTDWEAVAPESAENRAGGGGTAEQPAYVIYTSGSTGTPKGVMIPQRAVHRLVLNTNYLRIEPSERIAQVSNFSFDAVTFEIWGALLCGACLVCIDKEVVLSPEEFARELRRQKISTLFITTALFNQIGIDVPSAFGSLRLLLFGGEAVEPKWVRQVLSGGRPERLLHVYGPTESTTFATFQRVEEVAAGAATIPIGRPLANTEIYLLDKYLSPVPVGVTGELYIGGDGLAHGYLNQPALTAEKFIPDLFGARGGARLYRTGDLARYLPDGAVEFVGRNDEQVKLRGFRIELEEIERSLNEHPQVRGNVVSVRNDATGDRRLVAYAVADVEDAPSAGQLRDFLKEKLPDYMIPSAFVIVDKLPLTPNGKVDRRALPEPVLTRTENEAPLVAPRNPLELRLTQLWEDVFGISPISVTDNFFDLGGHSLLAVRLTAQIHKQFGKSIGLSVILEEGNIANLAVVIQPQIEAAPYTPLVAIQPRGDKRPFFCVHAIGGQVMGYYHLARRLGNDQPFYGLQAPFLTEIGDERKSIEQMATEYIEALRAVQPEGPYLLGGYSYGGFVAFEMAVQLRRLEQEVALLAIMDTWSPSIYQQLPKDDDDAYMLAMLARVRARESEKHLALSHEYLRQLASDEQFAYVFEQLKGVGIFDDTMSPELGARYIRSFVKGHRARQMSIHDYTPRLYPGRITLFRCSEVDPAQLEVFEKLAVDIVEPTFGWHKLSTEPVEVLEVPGYHERMCQEPYVQVLAERLGECIERAALTRRAEHAQLGR